MAEIMGQFKCECLLFIVILYLVTSFPPIPVACQQGDVAIIFIGWYCSDQPHRKRLLLLTCSM